MDMETREMEKITVEMRAAMRQWVRDPGNEAVKARYTELQKRYQQMYLELTKGVATP